MIVGLVVWILTAGGLEIGSPEAHPMSRSSSRVDLEEGLVRWTVRVQMQSVVEVLPGLDLDGDGVLSPGEASAGEGEIVAYLAAHYGVRGAESAEWPEWVGEVVRVGQPADVAQAVAGEWLEAVWEVAVEDEVAGVGVRMELFEVTSPDHIDVFELRRRGSLRYTALFGAQLPGAWIATAGDAGAGFLDWVGWGFWHILTGWDHLAFLLALLMCVRGPRQMVGVVTAFTLAHSVTLALAALEWVDVPSRFVELVIALSISFVAIGGLAKAPRKGLWLEAMVFGLVHGLGFAGFLGDALLGEERKLGALVGFNVGVEVGQLCFLVPVGLGLWFVVREREVEGGWWVPRGLRRVVSVVVGVAGVLWFLERAGWLPLV